LTTLYEFILSVGITTMFWCTFNLASRHQISFALFISGWLSDLSSLIKSFFATSFRNTSTWGLDIGDELVVLVLLNPVAT
jgi:hypothetical protein